MSTTLEQNLNVILNEKEAKILPENIKKGVQIFNIVGTLEPDKPDQTKTVTPTIEEQVITPDTGYELASVTVEAVTSDIDSNIVAENIKKDISILGVTGTYEGSTSGAIKQFSTIEEMQADTTAKEGDKAVVYRSEIQNATVDSRFQVATFPDTVVLDTALTDRVEVRYRAVDSSKMFDCWGSLDSSSFRMDCYTESGSIRIQYTSTDGITYTRTDTTGNPVDFGTEIYYERTEYWNDAIGKFIQIGGNIFEGLYENVYTDDTTQVVLPSLEDIVLNGSNSYLEITDYSRLVNTEKLVNILNQIATDKSISTIDGNLVVYMQNNKLYAGYITVVDESYIWVCGINYDETNNSYQFYVESSDTADKFYSFELDLANETYTVSDVYQMSKIDNYNVSTVIDNLQTFPIYYMRGKFVCYNMFRYTDINGNAYPYSNSSFVKISLWNKLQIYQFAPTQLSATPDYVYEKEFYGKNGVETGTLGTPDNSFADTNAGVYSKIQNYYDNLEPRVLTDDDKTINTNIYFIPVKKDGTVLLDTSKVTNMASMFYNCTNLTTIPLLNTSKVTNMDSMFSRCTNLTEISLLNTSSVTNMDSMFRGCTNLTEIPLLNTSSVTNMESMFYGCTNLTTIPLLNTSSVTNMDNMFADCKNLTTIPLLNTSKVTNISGMFYGCTNLTEIPLLDTSKVTYMGRMFYNCTNLTEIPLLDTSKVTYMEGMFNECTNLTEIPLLDTSKVTYMDSMFYRCTNLTTISLLNTSSVTNMNSMFADCTSLSDESLNNILAMCKNATSYTGTKTLKYIGLTSEQATKCTTLSNYQAFTSAGWTTGY